MENDEFVLVERQDGESWQCDDELPPVTEEDLERIRSWLSPTEFDSESSEYQKHLNAHAPGTGLWLFQTKQYKNWHDLESGALWIQGIPGSGKSVVAANLIQTLKTENAPVLFFFSRRIIKSNSNPRNLVRDCLYQLLGHSLALQRSLETLMKQHPDVSNTPFHELWKILLLALTTVPKVYLLFDALDELAVEEGDFLRCLLELGQKKSASIKLLITSRALPYLQEALSNPSIAIVRLTGRKVNMDIAIYIMHRIVQQQERILTTEDQSMIKDVLCERSQDLFLYARLMLDEILKQSIPVSVHVRQLSLSLGDMYVDLLHEHSARSGASLHFQSRLLSWITHSSRPLRTTELAALINLHSDRCGLADSQDAKTMVRTSCGPLLEILDDETVQVIHHSFTEFLLDSSRSTASETLQSEKWFPAFMPAVIHRSMTLYCLDYLMSGCFESWSVAENSNEIDSPAQKQLMIHFHFLQYSSQNLLYHAAKCDPFDAAFMSAFDRFLKYGSHDFESWKDFWFSKTKNSVYDNFQPLHVAAQAGLTAYTVHLLEKGQNPDLVDSHRLSAIAYCAMHGHAETMAALLDHGAAITIDDLDGLTPIHHAAKGNHVKALQSLLDAGADPMSPKSKEDSDYSFHTTLGKTPVQYACELGNADVIPVLLQRLNPDVRSEIFPHWAAETGQARVLSMLLEYPEVLANINKKDIRGNTALYLAARVKDSSTVRILLQHGADVHLKSFDFDNSREKPASCESAENSLGLTPLQGWAHVKWYTGRDEYHNSVEEWEKTCTLLIEAGSDIEARDEKGQTILFAWPEQLNYGYGDSGRSERFVSLLLRHHANPSATDDKGNTPLHQPRRWTPIHKVIEFLTRAGADINMTRDGDLVTPLIAAAKSQCTDVKEYIDHGANPNMQDSDGNTALHHICRSWCFEFEHILEWLTFADPTIKNHKGQTCIYNLRWGNGGEGRVRAIPLLVEKGLDLESKDRKGRTALLAACQNAEPHFIHGLIRYGADAKSRDFQNKSCLHLVAQRTMSSEDNGLRDIGICLKVMKSLIQAGVDINGVDFDGNTPFFDAIVSGDHFKSLKIRLNTILELGGVANTVNHRGQTALHIVASLGNSDTNDYAHPGVSERIDFLLQQCVGIDLHARDNEGVMAIHCAASISEFNTWKLVQAGAYLQTQANDGRNPLHFAAVAGQSNAVDLLCNLYGKKSLTIDQKDESGRTPLHYATASGNSESVYYLLQSGVDSNIRDAHGLTPLHACAEHSIDIAKLRKHRRYEKLPYWRNVPPGLQRLYPFMDTRKGSPIHKRSWILNTAISQEERASSIQDVVSLLLAAGADTCIRDNLGQTAYDVAAFLNNEALANVLSPLSPQANIASPLLDPWYSIRSTNFEKIAQSIHLEDTDVYTTLQTAISLGNQAVLDCLLKAGVDPTAVGPDTLTPVHTITHWGLISMMKIVAPYIREINLFSPPLLHVAAAREQSNLGMVNLLIELGVDVNAPYQEFDDESRRSTGAPIPSYSAAHILAMGNQWWNISALDSLCKAGAKLEMTDGDGNTVLQCALNGKKCGSWGPGFWRDQTLEVVLRHGADINALSSENGATPLTTALESRRDSTLIRKLLDAGADINIGKVPAIFTGIESENLEVTKAIIDAGGDVNALYQPEEPRSYGRGPKVETPLLAAAMCDRYFNSTKRRSNREAIMTLLLQRGADPLADLQNGETTVLHQISHYHGLIAPILKLGVDCDTRDSQNRTPLLLACSPAGHSSRFTEDESTPRDIILAGANIHVTDKTGLTPLHLTAQSGNTKIVTLLLEKGASVSATDDAGLTPLYYVLKHTHFEQKLEISKALISAGAEPLFKGPDGESALHLLAPTLLELSPADDGMARDVNSRRENKVNFLAEFKALYRHFVDSGCDREGRDNLGNSPLWPYVKKLKLRNDYIRVAAPTEEDVKEMFDNHDVFAVNYEGDTLLHVVAARVEAEGSGPDGLWLFKELMKRGLDVKKQNKKGVSALDVAAAFGKEDILGLFAREE